MAVLIGLLSIVNSFLWLLQAIFLGRRIERTTIEQDPIFVIGHWRSGTTLLHELLVRDPRHTYPDTYACFTPEHFLVSRYLVPWWLKFLMPSRRPMDNMAVGWKRPQEDEFALCNMGVPSPYLAFAFPNQPLMFPEYLDLKGLSPTDLEHWKATFCRFLQCVSVAGDGRRIVLKTPLHTGRIDVLREMYPKAYFVHIVRDPYVIFPSTVRTWQRISEDQGLQRPTHEGLEEDVLSNFERMYESFEASRDHLDPNRFCEVRYEDLIDDPVGQVRGIYEQLNLAGFDQVLPALEDRAAKMRNYTVNRHQLSDEMRDMITDRWGDYIQRYEYWDSADAQSQGNS